MAEQKSKKVLNCDELREYFEEIFEWVEKIFPKYRGKLMKGQQWGIFYNKYGKNKYDAEKLEEEITKLMKDFDVLLRRQ